MKKTAICLILLIMTISIQAQIGYGGARYAQEGVEFYQRGDYNKAIDKFLAADRSANGRVPEYHYWLGRLYIAVADTSSARTWFDKYRASGDQAYRAQVDDYQRIIQRQEKIFSKINIRPMPDYINSRNSDYGAIPDPEGRYLYFTSMRSADMDKENIWRAEIFRSGFGRPELVAELSTNKNEAFGCFSMDGSGAWIFGNYEKDKLDGDIYFVERNEDGWSTPRNVVQFNSSQVETHPMVFRDRMLFFASSREGGYGGMDIYVTEKIGGVWTDPLNLGPVINTPGNEQTPFLDLDGRTLFFSSNGHPGFGGYDIFKTYQIDNGWQDWSLPENLGLPVNSDRNDRYFYHTPGTNEGFISSDRSVAGFENIYQFNFTYASPPSYLVRDSTGTVLSVDVDMQRPSIGPSLSRDTILSRIDETLDVLDLGLTRTSEASGPLPERNLIPERVTRPEVQVPVEQAAPTPAQPEIQAETPVQPEPVSFIRVSGIVQDQKEVPVRAEVEISCVVEGSRTRELATTDSQGAYEITLPSADSYAVVVNASGYSLYSQDVILDPGADALALDISLQKLDIGDVKAFDHILFAYESSQLDERAMASLDDVVLTLLNNPKLRINIFGHALDGGTATYNKELSEKRATAVFDYLISKGIDAKRLSWKSFGNTKPYNSAISETQKARNRRVEIEVK